MTQRLGLAACAMLCTLTLGAIGAQTAQRQPVAAGVHAVEIDALALDSNGGLVTDLNRDDFTIIEDGAPQTLSSFALMTYGGVSNGDDRPLTVIVFDDMNLDVESAVRARTLAGRYVEGLDASVLVGAVTTSASGELLDATADRRVLYDFINRGKFAAPVPFRSERVYSAYITLGVLAEMSETLDRFRHRRKVVVLLSHGIGLTLMDPAHPDNNSSVAATTERMIRTAQRANVALYTIDPAGLPDPPGGDPAGAETRRDSLSELASETGGLAVVNTNGLEGAIDRIVQENRSYYLIGYDSNRKADGKYHSIDVRVRKPGVDVRARRGYVAY